MSFDEKTNNNSFKDFYAKLALNLVNEHPYALTKFNKELDLPYYKKCLSTDY